MPTIHPDLGVSCMSIHEFWKHEAEISGTNVAQVMQDFANDMAADEEQERQLILNDKSSALSLLQEYYDPQYGDYDYQPVEIVTMLDAKVSFGSHKSTSSQFTALVKCSDDKIRKLNYSRVDYSGSYMEPPDSDTNCQEIEQ